MSSKDLLHQLGLGDLYSVYEGVISESSPEDTTVTWGGESLLSGRCYRVVSEDENSMDNLLKSKLSSLDGVLFLSTVIGWDTSINCEKFYVDGVEVIEELLEFKVNEGINVVVISPGSKLTFLESEFSDSSMGFVMERLRLIMNKYIKNDVFLIMADLNMYDGRSDARRVLRASTEKELK